MLKNDTLKNGTSRIGLYGSAPLGNEAYNSVFNYDLIAISDTRFDRSISNEDIQIEGSAAMYFATIIQVTPEFQVEFFIIKKTSPL